MKSIMTRMALAVPLLLLLPSRAQSTTIIPYRHLGETARHADAVVLATAESLFETAAGTAVFYDARFRVVSRVHGPAPGAEMTLRRLSHRHGDLSAEFAGDFIPEEGKTYLLFLKNAGDHWRPLAMCYYVFESKTIGDEAFLVPQDESFNFAVVPRPDGTVAEPLGVYRQDKLLEILRQYDKGIVNTWDASSALTGLEPGDFPRERALPTGCSFDLGSGQARWQDAAINVYYDDTDEPAGFSGTLDNVLAAMNGSYVDIDPFNSGQTSFSPDCGDGSIAGNDFTAFLNGLNGTQATLIMFDDPCNQIADLSSCEGTLAIGGGYTSSSTHMYKGDVWKNALWGYVVVNNGVPACLTASEYEIMLTHELTHTYRMAHLNASLYPNQNMNPSCCNTINTKDMECMNYTYDANLPVELIAFDVQVEDNRQVLLHWSTAQETDNAYFALERSADGVQFELLKTIPGHNSTDISHYEWTDKQPLPGLSYYRLNQIDTDGKISSLGVRAVRLGAGDEYVQVFPNPADGDALTIKTDLPGRFNGTLEVVDMGGRVVLQRELSLDSGLHTLVEPIPDLSPGIYWLRLRETTGTRVVRFFRN
ncbi:MAG: T9SS type A sorting domain-containing protein [Saprospiraceae bacterium]|nr:T9SS type A sorting domain-containing protein [Lewinellaceae bacterium]